MKRPKYGLFRNLLLEETVKEVSQNLEVVLGEVEGWSRLFCFPVLRRQRGNSLNLKLSWTSASKKI
jgi:hypothetical protein